MLRALAVLPGVLGSSPSTQMAVLDPLVTPVPGDPMTSSGLLEHCVHLVDKHPCRQNIGTHDFVIKYEINMFHKPHPSPPLMSPSPLLISYGSGVQINCLFSYTRLLRLTG